MILASGVLLLLAILVVVWNCPDQGRRGGLYLGRMLCVFELVDAETGAPVRHQVVALSWGDERTVTAVELASEHWPRQDVGMPKLVESDGEGRGSVLVAVHWSTHRPLTEAEARSATLPRYHGLGRSIFLQVEGYEMVRVDPTTGQWSAVPGISAGGFDARLDLGWVRLRPTE